MGLDKFIEKKKKIYVIVAGDTILHKSQTYAGAEKWFKKFAPDQSPEIIEKLPEKRCEIKEVEEG